MWNNIQEQSFEVAYSIDSWKCNLLLNAYLKKQLFIFMVSTIQFSQEFQSCDYRIWI